MMAAMRIVSIWIRGEDGQPALDPALGRADDPDLKRKVLAYLHSGLGVLRASGLTEDRLDPANGKVVPLIYMTDGEWIWSGSDIYYLERHGILPRAEFLAHMAAHDYKAPPVSMEAGREAAKLLRR